MCDMTHSYMPVEHQIRLVMTTIRLEIDVYVIVDALEWHACCVCVCVCMCVCMDALPVVHGIRLVMNTTRQSSHLD